MTENQIKRAEKIFKERKEKEAEGNLTDLLLDFWQAANEDYQFGKSRITSISCCSGVWTFFDAKQGEETSDTNSKNYQGVLATCFEKIRNISQSEINAAMLLSEIAELERIGFHVYVNVDKETFVMKI